MRFVCSPMGDVPDDWKERLRELTLGREVFALWRWANQSGRCWCVIAFEGEPSDPLDARFAVGWACFTLEDEPDHPVIGAYVTPERRGRGVCLHLVETLLRYCRPHFTGAIYAVSERWPRYVELIERCGEDHLEWA